MIDHPSVEKWQQFLDGQPALAEAQALEAHLATCAECQRLLDCQPLPTGVLPLLPEAAPRSPAPQAVETPPQPTVRMAPPVHPPGQPPTDSERPRYRSERRHAQG